MQSTIENRTKKKSTKVNAHAEATQIAGPDMPHGRGFEFEMAKTILTIDKFFGEGFAQKNPNLVGASLQAFASFDLAFGNIEDALNAVAGSLSELADATKANGTGA